MNSLTLNISPEQLVVLGFVVMAIIDLIKQIRDKDFWGVAYILGAALGGAIFAWATNVNLFSGILGGLSVPGVLAGGKFVVSGSSTTVITPPDGTNV